MKALLAPVVALGVKVLGTITDAQESEMKAVEELWPQVPHQVCQLQARRDAAQRAFEADKRVKTAMRKALQPKVRALRKQLKRDIPHGLADEDSQLSVLDDYAQECCALNRDGLAPLDFAAVTPPKISMRWTPACGGWKKRGACEPALCQKLAPGGHRGGAGSLGEPARPGHTHARLGAGGRTLLDESLAQEGEVVSNATVGSRLDGWREQMAPQLTDGTLSELEQECLTQFLQQLSNLRSALVQCYDRRTLPRTNNEMERSISSLKTSIRKKKIDRAGV